MLDWECCKVAFFGLGVRFFIHETVNIDVRDNFNSRDNALAISEHVIPSFKIAELQSVVLARGAELGSMVNCAWDRATVIAREMIRCISNILQRLVSLRQDD